MNQSPKQTNHRRHVLEWLGAGSQSYDELLARYRAAMPAHDVDTQEAFAVLIGSLIGEGLLGREVAPEGDPEAGAIRRVWLSDKGKESIAARSSAAAP